MKRTLSVICVLCIIALPLLSGCEKVRSAGSLQKYRTYERIMKQDLLCLMLAYPEFIDGLEKDESEKVYIKMKSGKKILYDDGRKKSTEEKLSNPDLQDMMEQIYPLDDISSLMDENYDPGRIRVYSLLKEVYGSSESAVKSNLKPVKAIYKNYAFNRQNGAAEALNNVMKELEGIYKNNPKVRGAVIPISGTYNYRYIAGTDGLSPHAFGIAIDLARDKRDYWKWVSRRDGQKRLEEYPREIVKIFEKYNFIWGGKWGHFDILHFEYRPELILKARYFSEEARPGEKWFDGLPNEESIRKYVNIIEDALS